MSDLRIRVRGDTGANWSSNNPILGLDELGYDRTAKAFKIGDGATHWNELPDVRLGPPVISEADGSVSLRTDNLAHKFTLRATGGTTTVELDGANILFDITDLQEILADIETNGTNIASIKSQIDAIYTDILAQKELSDAALLAAQAAITTVAGSATNAENNAAAALQSKNDSATSATSSLNAATQANDVLNTVRQVAAASAFSRLDKIVSGDFDVVTKKKNLVRTNLNKIIFASGIAGAKLIVPPDLVLATDPGIAIMEIHNIGTEDISIENVVGSTGSVMPRYLQRWVAGGSTLTTGVVDGDKTVSITLSGMPAVAKGGMVLFFLCATCKFFSSGSVGVSSASWTAGLTGALTPRIVTGMPTQKSGAAHLFSFEYKLVDDFPGGSLTATFVIHANVTAWDVQALLLDQVDILDSTPVWAGDNVSVSPNHPVSITTAAVNCLVFNFSSRNYVTGSAPTQQAANAIATVWSNSFPDNVDETYNSHVDMLGYDVCETLGTAKTYNPNMGKLIQCQNSAIAYRGLSGTPVPGSSFNPTGAYTLQPNKMCEILCDPAAPTVYHLR